MSSQDHVVVGVNETFDDGSQTAVRWAAEEALTRRAPLRIVTAYESALSAAALDVGGGPHRRVDAKGLISRAVALAAQTMDPRDVTGEVIDGSATEVLIEESAGAQLIVLGSRQLGALGAAVHSSAGASVAARAQCPVVVVRGPAGLRDEGAKVVAAVDATSASQDVLEFAFDYAARHRLPLQAVLCWHPDLLAAMQWRREQPPPPKAQARLAESLAGWKERYPDVAVTSAVVRERAPLGLVSTAEAQALLVVGRRTRLHVAAQALLGSTSQGVLHRATLPVAIVPTRVRELAEAR